MENVAVTPADFVRLEGKMDKMADAVEKLVLIEERQNNQTAKIEKMDGLIESLQASNARLHSRLDKFIYIGVGAWSILVGGFEIAKLIWGH